MSRIRNSLFGQIILQTGLVSSDQIEECLQQQEEFRAKGKNVPRLGELMAKKGLLTVEQVKTLLKQQHLAKKNKTRETSAEDKVTERPVFSNYTLIQKMGSDASGVTYKARHEDSGTTVTLKVLERKMAEDPEYLRRFQEHARRASQLKHPNILRILTAGSHQNQLFYTTEYVQGISLRRLLETRGKMDLQFTLNLGIAVASALEYGHAHGIFHQELSPSNIIILPDGSTKLTGFGSVPDPIRNLSQLAANVGETPFYVAPEQATDDGSDFADARTDIYSLGTVLYHAFSGKPPHAGECVEEVMLHIAEEEVMPLTMLVPDMPAEINDMVLTAMAPDPDDRQLSATKLLEELKELNSALNLDPVADPFNGMPAPQGSNYFSSVPGAAERTAGRPKRNTGKIARRDHSSPAQEKSGRGRNTSTMRAEDSSTNRGRRRKNNRAHQHIKKKGMSVATIIILLVMTGSIIAGLVYFIPNLLEQQEERKRENERQRQQLEAELRAAKEEAQNKSASKPEDKASATENKKEPAKKTAEKKPSDDSTKAPPADTAAKPEAEPAEPEDPTDGKIYNPDTQKWETVVLPPEDTPTIDTPTMGTGKRDKNGKLTDEALRELKREENRKKLEGLNLE